MSAISFAVGALACGGDEFGASGQAGQAGAAGEAGRGGAGGAAGKAGTAGAGGQAGGMAGAAGSAGAAGALVGQPCKVGTFACAGNALLVCNNSTLTYDSLDACSDTQFCDAEAGECKECKPGTPKGCASETTLELCSDGGSKKEEACPAAKPFCMTTGMSGAATAATCVECSDDKHCKLPTDEANQCFEAACVSGACSKKPSAAGSKPKGSTESGCTGLACDGAGKTTSSNLAAGTPCAGGVCNGQGVCGECNPGATECVDGGSQRVCSPEGKWQAPQSCGSKPACSAGVCQGVTQMAAAGTYTCALLEDSTVRCWGVMQFTDVKDWGPQLGEVEQLVARDIYLCALDKAGKVRCMGNNFFGQFGDNSKSANLEELVSAPSTSDTSTTFRRIFAADSFMCGIEKNNEGIYCWGDNGVQQLGLPAQLKRSLVPLKFEALSPATSADDLSLGADHGCLMRAGSVTCWGANHKGQIGNGKTSLSGEPPHKVSGLGGSVTAIVAHNTVQTAMLFDGSFSKLWYWGDFIFDPTLTQTATPKETNLLGPFVDHAFADSAMSAYLFPSKELFVAGKNTYGLVGDGTVGDQVAYKTHTFAPFDGLTLTNGHLCVWVKGGEAWCWGNNKNMQVGVPAPKGIIATPTKVQW